MSAIEPPLEYQPTSLLRIHHPLGISPGCPVIVGPGPSLDRRDHQLIPTGAYRVTRLEPSGILDPIKLWITPTELRVDERHVFDPITLSWLD